MFDSDDLLGANPRRSFEQLLEARCVAGDSFALMLVNLDEFETVSPQHGVSVSDLLIFEVACRLREKLSFRDVIVRSSDSQFAIFVPNLGDLDKAERLANALIERLETSMTVSGTRFRLTASIGITLFPQHGKDWKALLLSADTAAYDARTQGRGRISVSIPAVR